MRRTIFFSLCSLVILGCTVTSLAQPSMVSDLRPGASGSNPFWLTEYDGSLVFTANDGTTGTELYQYDGSSISLLHELVPGLASGGMTRLTPFGSLLVFRANAEVMGSFLGDEPWVFDGSTASNIKDINTAAGTTSSPQYFTVFNGHVYFSANNGSNGVEVWRTDGTEGGTALQHDIWAGSSSSSPTGFVEFGGNLYFGATDGSGNGQLYRITPAGVLTTAVDFEPIAWLAPVPFDIMAGELYVYGSDLANGSELWRTDGTQTNSFLVQDINPGVASSTIGVADGHAVMNGYLYFRANDGTNGYELWRTNGSTTEMVKDIDPSGSSFPDDFAVLDNVLFFSATTPDEGMELWMSDGTGPGTVLAADINPGTDDSSPQHLTVYNGELYFNADDGTNGPELWKYSTALPVTLTDFGVVLDSDRSRLHWTTQSESLLLGFAVEKSEGDQHSFQEIGFVDAMANDGQGGSYHFVDEEVRTARAFYRLRIVDTDGSHVYSRTVEAGTNPSEVSLGVYPNPARLQANVVVSIPRSDNVQVTLFDTLGRTVATIHDGPSNTGSFSRTVSLSQLPAGLYMIHARVGSTTYSKPLIVVD